MNLAPPENKDQLLSQAYMLCEICKTSLLDKSKRVYSCQTCDCYLCKDCKKDHILNNDHEVTKEKKRVVEGEEEEVKEKDKSQYLEGMLEDYYNLGFEDIIGKDIYTRFKYAKVRNNNFGLSNEEILLLNDQELNNLVSLKKYKPYRNDEDRVNLHRIAQMKKKLRGRIEDEKKQLKNILKQDIKLQKEKLLGIKTDAKEQLKQLKKAERLKERQQEKKEIHFTSHKNTESSTQHTPTSSTGKRSRKDLYRL